MCSAYSTGNGAFAPPSFGCVESASDLSDSKGLEAIVSYKTPKWQDKAFKIVSIVTVEASQKVIARLDGSEKVMEMPMKTWIWGPNGRTGVTMRSDPCTYCTK